MNRILKFDVEGQNIKKNSNCDFSSIERGTKDYLIAEFTFSSDWDGYYKAGVFRGSCEKEVATPILDNRCTIPFEALTKEAFVVQVVGKSKRGIVKSRTVEVTQL